jgi:hypothetical protein
LDLRVVDCAREIVLREYLGFDDIHPDSGDAYKEIVQFVSRKTVSVVPVDEFSHELARIYDRVRAQSFSSFDLTIPVDLLQRRTRFLAVTIAIAPPKKEHVKLDGGIEKSRDLVPRVVTDIFGVGGVVLEHESLLAAFLERDSHATNV